VGVARDGDVRRIEEPIRAGAVRRAQPPGRTYAASVSPTRERSTHRHSKASEPVPTVGDISGFSLGPELAVARTWRTAGPQRLVKGEQCVPLRRVRAPREFVRKARALHAVRFIVLSGAHPVSLRVDVNDGASVVLDGECACRRRSVVSVCLGLHEQQAAGCDVVARAFHDQERGFDVVVVADVGNAEGFLPISRKEQAVSEISVRRREDRGTVHDSLLAGVSGLECEPVVFCAPIPIEVEAQRSVALGMCGRCLLDERGRPASRQRFGLVALRRGRRGEARRCVLESHRFQLVRRSCPYDSGNRCQERAHDQTRTRVHGVVGLTEFRGPSTGCNLARAPRIASCAVMTRSDAQRRAPRSAFSRAASALCDACQGPGESARGGMVGKEEFEESAILLEAAMMYGILRRQAGRGPLTHG